LTFLAVEKQVSAASQNLAFNALLFLFKQVCDFIETAHLSFTYLYRETRWHQIADVCLINCFISRIKPPIGFLL
ncbi:MAG: phage integrase N-terminal SAM-like domain-containing protein, partial [Gammaproteobacteria bacterium]